MRRLIKWLYPGINVKRWIVLSMVGLLAFIIGMGLIVNWRLLHFLSITEQYVVMLVYMVTGQFFSLRMSGAVIASFGIAAVVFGFRRTFHSLISALIPEDEESLAEMLLQKKQLERGPKVVVVGGGTGLNSLLRGIKQYSSNLTAIVTVTDDGGSSGKLREELGVLPPGDIRNCLVALADTEPLMEKLFQYRFGEGTGLAGHNFGNLFIATLSEITGDFEQAVKESSKVLAVRGSVLPSTLDNVTLCAEDEQGQIVRGETTIVSHKGKIVQLFLEPECCSPVPEAITALRNADLIILGPGSLYTSIIPNLLIPGMVEAIQESKGLKVYVCNVMTQPGETDGYTAGGHLETLKRYLSPGIIDYIVVNNQEIRADLLAKYEEEGAQPVYLDVKPLMEAGVKVVARPLILQTDVVRHDPERLAQTLFALVAKRHLSLHKGAWRDLLTYVIHRLSNKAGTKG